MRSSTRTAPSHAIRATPRAQSRWQGRAAHAAASLAALGTDVGAAAGASDPADSSRRTAWDTDSPMRLPGPLSLEQYAQCTSGCAEGAGIEGPFDVLGVHVGSHRGDRDRASPARTGCGGCWRWACRSSPRRSSNARWRSTASSRLKPATEGGHVLGAWRGCFAFRQPPYDLADTQRRFVEHLLAANPGAAFRAASAYPIEKEAQEPRRRSTVFAPTMTSSSKPSG